MYAVPDRLDCYYKGILVVTTTGLGSGNGTLTWAFNLAPGDPLWCLVTIYALQNGTEW